MPKKQRSSDPAEFVRQLAMTYPETEEGTSCNKSAYKARGKAFAFVGESPEAVNIMLKLGDSADAFAKFAKSQPHHYRVGKAGWMTMDFPRGTKFPMDELERWIDESFRLIAIKKLVKVLDER